jgi:WD40 repeat protein
MSPNGRKVVTAAGDETLRFWNVFPAAADRQLRGRAAHGTTGMNLFGSSSASSGGTFVNTIR